LRAPNFGYNLGRPCPWAQTNAIDVTSREPLTGSYPAVAETVPLLRRALATLATEAGGTKEQVDAVRLAVSEALTNVVVHAYRAGSGEVHVSAGPASSELWVLIADDGCGMRPKPDSPGLGMGLALIAAASDDFSIVSRSNGGVEIRMRFRLGSDAPRGQARGSDSSATFAASPVFSTTT
jgi:anti-sigma regulatory factor (Ser/Thr protein kinase)